MVAYIIVFRGILRIFRGVSELYLVINLLLRFLAESLTMFRGTLVFETLLTTANGISKTILLNISNCLS